MLILSEAEKQAIWEEVRKEFPDDDTMQQVHFVRLLHYYQTKGMTPEEKVGFYSQAHDKKKSA